MNHSKCCGAEIIGVQYSPGHQEEYDGISEWVCSKCGERRGRWSGKKLEGNDFEYRYGRGTPQ